MTSYQRLRPELWDRSIIRFNRDVSLFYYEAISRYHGSRMFDAPRGSTWLVVYNDKHTNLYLHRTDGVGAGCLVSYQLAQDQGLIELIGEQEFRSHARVLDEELQRLDRYVAMEKEKQETSKFTDMLSKFLWEN